jgi:hypothetical protein
MLGHNHFALMFPNHLEQSHMSTLSQWVDMMNAKSLQTFFLFGKDCERSRHSKIIGNAVYEPAFLDADGALVELLHKQRIFHNGSMLSMGALDDWHFVGNQECKLDDFEYQPYKNCMNQSPPNTDTLCWIHGSGTHPFFQALP